MIPEITGAVLSHEVNAYVKLKQNLRRHEKLDKSSFERFLKKIQEKLENWSMRQFLQAIEKWTQDYYENDINKNRGGQSNSAAKTALKQTSNSFRLRKNTNGQIHNNLTTLYENILR